MQAFVIRSNHVGLENYMWKKFKKKKKKMEKFVEEVVAMNMF